MFNMGSISKTFKAQVTFNFRTESGAWSEGRFTGIFNRLKKSEAKELLGNLAVDGEDLSLCRLLLTGWEGVRDEEGNELEYSDENLARLIEALPSIHAAILDSYRKSVTGQKN